MANFGTSLVHGEIRKKLVKSPNLSHQTIKKDDSKQERMFGMVAEIPIGDTFDELVEMDFPTMEISPHYCAFRTHFHVRRPPFSWARKRKTNKRPEWFDKCDFRFVGGVWGAWNYRRG